LAVSLLVLALDEAVTEGVPVRWAAWAQRPGEELCLRAGQGVATAPMGTVFHCLLVGLALALVWGLPAGWIARAEFLRQSPPAESGEADRPRASPTAWVRRKASALVSGFVLAAVNIPFLMLPGLLAGLVCRVFPWGIGAVVVALLLPLLLACSLAVVTIGVGAVAWTLMPAAVAAEDSDHFDALSRAYSYLYQRPVAFALWGALSLGLAALPLLAVYAGGFDAAPGVTLAAGALSLSLFWTLQSLVYLKMRRLVDGTPETELGVDRSTRASKQPGVDAAGTPADGPPAERDQPQPAPEPIQPRHPRLSFGDTLTASGTLSPRLVAVLSAMGRVALCLGVGLWLVWLLAGVPGQAPSPDGLREAVGRLAAQEPAVLLAIAAGVVLAGAVWISRTVRAVARAAAVGVVFAEKVRMSAARGYVRRVGRRGLGSVALVAGGLVCYLAAGCLAFLAGQGLRPWEEALALAGVAAVLLGAGALGLGVVAVEGNADDGSEGGGWRSVLANGPETLVSAVANLAALVPRSLAVAGYAVLTWWLTAASLACWGGDSARWVRWGLDGSFVPPAEGGLDRAASGIALVWLAALAALAAAYPVANWFGWGAAGYLRARQQAEDVPAGRLELTDEERSAVVARREKRQAFRARLSVKGKLKKTEA
jgi:hypothetical protein